ncbi:longitudinals lacking protein, isoforms H/M/V-like isoform X5 [Homarus americanus]|uniref:longitudinals lacking protein, isoforms H/M/V-like isoform X5 n=1 Tax=Homarus americanus TaxID=6706 RepID=UPI001C46F410|nr:longitudinals lacking protein, isoforms H/M/V-like isoform X5 [Homarus americanus]
MEELLSLKWNNHRSTFLHILGVLRDKQAYTDVTLACDGKFYSVHKLVLSTCSDYFCAMFDKTACKSPVIVLKDIKSEDLEALLDYMYLGEVNVRQCDLASLIKAAENLRIKGLAVPDDEPLKKGAVTTPSRAEPTRRDGGSGSPPSKRKRRDEGEDGREDVRPPPPLQSGLHTPPPPPRPKSPVSQRLSPSPLRTSQESLVTEDRDSRPLSSPAESPVTSHVPSHQSSQQLTHQPSQPPLQSSQPLPEQQQTSNQYRGEDTPTFVKVEMEEEDTGDIHQDSYNLSGDGYKEEEGGDLGGDLSNDLPEFLQQAASGALAGTSASYHHAFAGPSGFQPEVSGWQGDSQSLPGSFAGLGFQPSTQDNPPGVASRDPRPRGHSHLSTSEVAIARALLTIPDQSTTYSPATPFNTSTLPAHSVSKISLQSYSVVNSCSVSTASGVSLSSSSPTPSVSVLRGSSCPECGKIFRGDYHKYNLKKHLTIHAGLRPYSCPICNMAFNQKVSMKRHFASVHKILDPKYKVDPGRPADQ